MGPVTASRSSTVVAVLERTAAGGRAAGVSRERVGRPLIVTADALVLDELLRVAASVGVECEVAPDVGAVAGLWWSAAAVLVGADQVADLAAQGLSRRPGTVVVGGPLDRTDVWRHAVVVGADDVVFLPDAEEWLAEFLADASDGRGQGIAVGVVGARGGAGAEMLAAALGATAAEQGRQVVLVDGDPLGGGLDLLVGCERAPGLRWPDLDGSRGRVSGAALREALPTVGTLAVVSWDRRDHPEPAPEVVRTVLTAAARGSDLVVVDLPRRGSLALQEAWQRLDRVFVVLPAEVRAASAGRHVVQMLRPAVSDVRAVVRGPSPTGLAASVVADAIGLPFAGHFRSEPELARLVDQGVLALRRRGSLARCCRSLLDDLPAVGLS